MAYTKTTWVNGSAPPISAENLNNMENGIYANDQKIAALTNDIKIKSLTGNDAPSAVSVPNNAINYTEIQSVTLTPGIYILQGCCVFATATNQNIAMLMDSTATATRSNFIAKNGANMANEKMMLTVLADIESTTTIKLFARQASGSSMNVLGALNYIRVGAK